MNINWYPGHMKKTKELIVENLKLVDLIIEILDARIPFSSKNPDISKLANNKKKIIVLNKIDLIDEKQLLEWETYFSENNLSDFFVPLSVEKGKNFNVLRAIIDKVYEEKLAHVKKRGLRKTEVRMMIVGIPNVGKSMFINRFSSKYKAKVGNKPGFTKGKQWIKMSDKIELLDTPGVLWPKFEDDYVAYNLAITGSIKDDILPLEKVAEMLLNRLKEQKKLVSLITIYQLMPFLELNNLTNEQFAELDNIAIFDILEKRHNILKQDVYNYDRIARILLKDYRSGKIGKIMLERPRNIAN